MELGEEGGRGPSGRRCWDREWPVTARYRMLCAGLVRVGGGAGRPDIGHRASGIGHRSSIIDHRSSGIGHRSWVGGVRGQGPSRSLFVGRKGKHRREGAKGAMDVWERGLARNEMSGGSTAGKAGVERVACSRVKCERAEARLVRRAA
jgi:hypothetical protein